MLQSLLSLDTSLLVSARGLVGPEYALLVQIFGESIVLWCMIVLLFLWFKGRREQDIHLKVISLQIFFTIILVFGIYAIINLGLPQWRPSPQDVVGGIAPLIPHPIDNSFPSGHALFSGAFLVGLWKYYRHSSVILLTACIALITLSARVIGGVHYPGDIVGGLLLGSIGGIILARLIRSVFMEIKIYPLILKIASWLKL